MHCSKKIGKGRSSYATPPPHAHMKDHIYPSDVSIIVFTKVSGRVPLICKFWVSHAANKLIISTLSWFDPAWLCTVTLLIRSSQKSLYSCVQRSILGILGCRCVRVKGTNIQCIEWNTCNETNTGEPGWIDIKVILVLIHNHPKVMKTSSRRKVPAPK